MSLDQNLFTLNIVPSPNDPNVVDLVDSSGNAYYRKQRVQNGTAYTVHLYVRIPFIDPVADSLLATATAPSPASKHKTLQLYNPEALVELKYTGTLSFKWGFKWENHEYEWRREECYMLRKPDPSVLVAVTKEPAGRLKTSSVQILDYNLNRFEIEDRKGLEIVILAVLLTLHDANDAYHVQRPEDSSASSSSPPVAASALTGLINLSLGSRRPSTTDIRAMGSRTPSSSSAVNGIEAAAPAIPPRPPPRTGIERISELHMLRTLQGEGEANEIEVGEEGTAEDFAQFAHNLLMDDAMLFITVRSASPAEVPKVLRVVEETKRLRHKSGIEDEQELHQYVIYDTVPSVSKGPRRINLDDPAPKDRGRGNVYAPPNRLMVHLSKIDMPELKPKADVKDPRQGVARVVDGRKGGASTSFVPRNDSQMSQDQTKAQGKRKEVEKGPAPLSWSNTRQTGGQHEKEKSQKNAEKEYKKVEKERTRKGSPPHQLTRPSAPTSAYHISSQQTNPFRSSLYPSQPSNAGIHAGLPPAFPPRAPGATGYNSGFMPPPVNAQRAPKGAQASPWQWDRR